MEPTRNCGVAADMSTQTSARTKAPGRDPLSIVASLFGAALVGTAASVIHGAFGRMTSDAREARRSALPAKAAAPRETAPQPAAGEGAARPTDIPSPGWWEILKRTFHETNRDRVLAVAGGVTFYGLLSLFPAVTVLVSLYGLVADPQSISEHLQMLASFLPESAMSIIGEQVQRITSGDDSKLGLALAAGVLVALWSANSGMKSMMEALNIAYDVEEKRSFFALNAVSLFFTFSAILGIIVMFAVVALVPVFLQLFWLGSTVDFMIWAGRWPLAFVLILAALAILYRYGPSRPNVKWRWITPGSLLAAVGLLVFSMLFSWYAANFGKFNETYGSLGAAIGFMTWMWLSGSIVLIGAELNAEIENQASVGPKPSANIRA
jgi:membrane protein